MGDGGVATRSSPSALVERYASKVARACGGGVDGASTRFRLGVGECGTGWIGVGGARGTRRGVAGGVRGVLRTGCVGVAGDEKPSAAGDKTIGQSLQKRRWHTIQREREPGTHPFATASSAASTRTARAQQAPRPARRRTLPRLREGEAAQRRAPPRARPRAAPWPRSPQTPAPPPLSRASRAGARSRS